MECGRGPGIYASRASSCQGICVFMWNTGEPRADEKRRKRDEESREEEAKRAARFSSERDEDRRESQWPTKVCCPFGTRDRVGRATP